MRPVSLIFIMPYCFCAPCRSVDGDRIRAADLAQEIVVFNQLAPQMVLGPAPFPGARRLFSGHELAALAAKNGISLEAPAPEICFERATAPLTVERIRAAMLTSLRKDDVRIEVVDFARQPVPSGSLEFPRSGLTMPPGQRPETPALWRGTLRYSSQHTLAVWASVRISEERPVVLATREIRRGAAISLDDISLVRRDIFPFTPHLETAADALGRVARKTILPNSYVSEELVEIPPDVEAGEIVHVIVTNGSTRITFDAVARSSGRKGDRIRLQNPESHHSFRALVDGKGRARIGEGT